MGQPQQQFESWLRHHHLRATAQRRAVLREASRLPGHFDVDALLASLRRDGSRVSRATVYRTVTQLVEAGLLRAYDLGDRRRLYEPTFNRRHHEHMVCVRCERIFEFVEDEIERLQDEVCRRHGFDPLSHTLQIHGVCHRCREASRAGADDE